MTKQEFITAVEAKPNFIKWAKVPTMSEIIGDVEKWNGIAFVNTPDGRNIFNVWFLVDKVTNEADWQNSDALEPEKNTSSVKQAALESYLKSNFDAYFILRVDFDNNWAEADVFKLTTGKLVKSNVLVFKRGTNPINHLEIV